MGSFQSSFSEKYSTPVEDDSNHNNQTSTRRSPRFPSELVDSLPNRELKSCFDIFRIGVGINPNGACLGRRRQNAYIWDTFQEVERKAIRFGTGLENLNLCPEVTLEDELYSPARRLRSIGVFMKNRPEWLILEQAINFMGYTLVPLYETLGSDAMIHIVEQTHLPTLVASIAVLPVLERLLPKMNHLKTIIFADCEIDVPDIEFQIHKANLSGKTVVLWKDVLQAGDDHDPSRSIDSKDLMDCVQTLCYTSGTTGNPKGAIYTHRGIIANISSVIRGLFDKEELLVSTGDCHMSYLPLAHIMERTICNIILVRGASIGFYSGDLLKLTEDAQLLQPSVFVSVPRLFTRINDKINCGVAQQSILKQFLFNHAMQTKINNLRKNGTVYHRIWDPLVFSNIKCVLGTRLRFFVCGGAPLDTTVEERIKVLFCCPLIQGYGLTETLGGAFSTLPGDTNVGHVGGPLPCIEFRLESIDEMEYSIHHNPPTGEVIIRGPSLFQGYFRAPELTQEVLDSNGWFHTGDVAVLLPNGAIKLIDRRKNIFKLAQGEYVIPEKIEMVYLQAKLVSQIFVFGYSTKNFLVGVLVPDAESVALKYGSIPLVDLCDDSKFQRTIQEEMELVAESNGLQGFERVKAIRLIPEPFTTENGILTPTLKLRRNVAKNRFNDLIDEMYEELS